MKEILPKIKILYYKNIMYTDYSFSNKLLKIWKHLEKFEKENIKVKIVVPWPLWYRI